MAFEIERKFLVNTKLWNSPKKGKFLSQAYLSVDPLPTVRIRISDEQAFLTIKGPSDTISRPEFEYEIPVAEASELMKLAVAGPVEKTRYEIEYGGKCWEIDVFSGKNSGLVLAEIELESEDEKFSKPAWLLNEVSGDKRYYNSYLARHPYENW